MMATPMISRPCPGTSRSSFFPSLKKVKKSSLMETMTLEGDYLLPRHLEDRLKEDGEKGSSAGDPGNQPSKRGGESSIVAAGLTTGFTATA